MINREPRKTTFIQARVLTDAGWSDAIIRNLSSREAMIERMAGGAPPRGTYVELAPRDVGADRPGDLGRGQSLRDHHAREDRRRALERVKGRGRRGRGRSTPPAATSCAARL